MVRNEFTLMLGLMLLGSLLWGCNYARMTDDAADDSYEAQFPQMPSASVPVQPGSSGIRMIGPGGLHQPLERTPAIIAQGRRGYGYFCYHCHGPEGEGHGTVGQSFAPLPTDLRSQPVQGQKDGELFYKIAFGYLRHPPLIYTVSEEDIWSIIFFLRSMNKSP